MNSTKVRDAGRFPDLLYKVTSATVLFRPKDPQKFEIVVEPIPSLRKANTFATAESRAVKIAQLGQATLVSKPEFAKFEAYCLAIDVAATVDAVASACRERVALNLSEQMLLQSVYAAEPAVRCLATRS